MIELAAGEIAMWALGIFVSVCAAFGTTIWVLLRNLSKYNDERQIMWDQYTIKTDRTLADLMEDHKDIKRSLAEINEALTTKVEKIVTDHAEHDKAMAAVLEIVRVIERRTGE